MDRLAIGLVTIGQSPRDDVVPELAARWPASVAGRVRVAERGALDDAGPAELARLAARPGEPLLVTRLRDGTEVTLAEHRVLPLLQAAVDDTVAAGAALVAVLCTGVDGALRCTRPLLAPGPLTQAVVAASAPGRRLGVVVPAADQVTGAERDWAAVSPSVLVAAGSPYGADDAVTVAVAAVADGGAELVILDCLGFGERHRELAERACGVPVLLPRAVLAGAIAAFA